MTRLRRLGAGALAALIVTLTLPARAADEEPSTATEQTPEDGGASARVLALSEEGSALYETGQYRRALEKFITAYAIGEDANLLFNMGRCYQQLGENDVAEEKYQAFIADPGADPAGVERARALLRSLSEPATSARVADSDASGPATLAPASAHATSAAHDPSSPRVLPWVALGTGVAFVAAGTTLYLLGAHDHDQVTGARGFDDPSAVSPLTEARARDLVSSGDTKKTSVLLFVTGTPAATATSGDAGADVQLSLTTARRGGSVSVQGRF
jgi:Tfp pilus assembly protein PilF